MGNGESICMGKHVEDFQETNTKFISRACGIKTRNSSDQAREKARVQDQTGHREHTPVTHWCISTSNVTFSKTLWN